MELQQYLRENLAERTAHLYALIIAHYIKYMEHHEQAKYKDVLDYIERMRSQGRKSATLLGYLAAIKAYYDYLKTIGKRKDHPCKHMRLKDRIDHGVSVQELFSSTELEQLLTQPPREITRKPSLVLRDRVILSLLIYQGLTTKNIVNLEVNDIDLEQATLYIKRATTLNARTLELHPKQIMLISRYLAEERLMLNKTGATTLILTRHYKPENGCGVHDIVKAYKHLYPGKTLTPLAIRQSVIANLLKAGKDIRAVQVFAGHRTPKTTEQYQQTGIEELTAAIKKFHPLG